MAFDRLPKQCFTLVDHFHFLTRIPLYDLMSHQFHISIHALSLFWTLFTRLASEWVIYAARICGFLLRDFYEAMRVVKRFYYFKHKYKALNFHISMYLSTSQDGSFSRLSRNKEEVVAPCHTTVQLHWESFATDGKDNWDCSQAESFKAGTHSLVQDC